MVYYLDAEFDPKKLTKAELRSILASHGILDLPPASAKKAELLELFNKEIIGKKNLILESQKSTKAKSDGIVFLDDSSRPSPKKPTRQRSRILDQNSSNESSPVRSNAENHAIKRPETPLAASTYKLVSRLENLRVNEFPNKKIAPLSSNRFYINSILGISTFILFSLYLYFKFWFIWPVYTSHQILSLHPKPSLYLKCPYPNDSLIGSCLDGKLYCASGYVLRKDLLGFGISCVIDKERLSSIQSIKQKIVNELQTRLGMSQCYNYPSASVSKTKLQIIIFKYFKNMKKKVFDDYFDICMRSLTQEETKIETILKEEEIYFSAKQPIHTIFCRAKISVRNVLEKRPVEVISGIFLAFLTTIFLFQLHSKQKQKKLMHQYYLLICKILKEQSAHHRFDPATPSFISTNQLRDAVLIKTSSKEKLYLWPRISAEVLQNSNIVESITIFRGEQTRVWEWIGADVSL